MCDIPYIVKISIKMFTLAELRAGELGYGVLVFESKFSVDEKLFCSFFNREGKLEALQLGFTPTSRSERKKNENGKH